VAGTDALEEYEDALLEAFGPGSATPLNRREKTPASPPASCRGRSWSPRGSEGDGTNPLLPEVSAEPKPIKRIVKFRRVTPTAPDDKRARRPRLRVGRWRRRPYAAQGSPRRRRSRCRLAEG
jgi:hypothetical protein